jgi:hypothetical protein
MTSRHLYTDSQSFLRNMHFGDPKAFFEAQQAAWDTTARLSDLAYNYSLEFNKTWIGVWKEQISQCTEWPQRLAECRTPEEVVKAHADLISQAARECKQGFDHLAHMGEELAREAGQAIRSEQDAARGMTH